MQTFQPPSSEEIAKAIQGLAVDLAQAHSKASNIAVIGIAGGGVELAKRLAQGISKQLGQDIPFGFVDISFHRDDISSNPLPKIHSFANLPFDVEDKSIILVDDVISSGRSTRAALNELFDQGRPACVRLAALVDRGERSLPIQPDFVGLKISADPDQKVKVIISDGPDTPDSISIET